MPEKSISLREIADRAIVSSVCYCGEEKERGQLFCRACYRSLLPDIRKNLYKDQVAENYDEAKKYLVAEGIVAPIVVVVVHRCRSGNRVAVIVRAPRSGGLVEHITWRYGRLSESDRVEYSSIVRTLIADAILRLNGKHESPPLMESEAAA